MSNWPLGHIRILTTLWQAGMSARKIGARLCRTRLSIIGKANRLKLVHGSVKPPPEPIHIPTLPPPRADSCSIPGCRFTPQPGSWQRRCAGHSTKAYLAAHQDKPRLVEVGRAGAS